MPTSLDEKAIASLLRGAQRDPYGEDSPYMRYSLATIALSNMKFESAAAAVAEIRQLLDFVTEVAEAAEEGEGADGSPPAPKPLGGYL